MQIRILFMFVLLVPTFFRLLADYIYMYVSVYVLSVPFYFFPQL